MHDDEIATKRLSDWKPETDIKLQKAFGKFVEEVGELLEAASDFTNLIELSRVTSFEDELADCLAFIHVIEHASDGRVKTFSFETNDISKYFGEYNGGETNVVISILSGNIGRSLGIVGRCQIQGLDKNDPEHHTPNIVTLVNTLSQLKISIICVIVCFNLNKERIEKRKLAKIDSKLPWVMGTAIDLNPDYTPFDSSYKPGTILELKYLDFPTTAPVIAELVKWNDDKGAPDNVLLHFKGSNHGDTWDSSYKFEVVRVLESL